MRRLYEHQYGVVGDGVRFPINRGVRQGDVLSPLLFNAVLEAALRKWRSVLFGHGVAMSDDVGIERMTNIRFADDLLLFAKTMEEAVEMLDALTVTLKRYGLELNVKKTKMLSAAVVSDDTMFIETGGFH